MTKQASQRYSFGPFQLDLRAQLLLLEGQAIPLKPKVFDLLVVLVENGGRVVLKEELMKRLWPESFVEDGNLAVSICELRKTLGDGRNGHAYIATVPRRGYRFAASLIDESDGAAEVIASYSSKGASDGGSIERTITRAWAKPRKRSGGRKGAIWSAMCTSHRSQRTLEWTASKQIRGT